MFRLGGVAEGVGVGAGVGVGSAVGVGVGCVLATEEIPAVEEDWEEVAASCSQAVRASRSRTHNRASRHFFIFILLFSLFFYFTRKRAIFIYDNTVFSGNLQVTN